MTATPAVIDTAAVRRRMQQGALELRRRQRPFRKFVEAYNPTLLAYEHIPRLIDVAERVMRGDIKRLMVIEPPRYLKSEIFSRLLPAYYLRRQPMGAVALASYVSSLAWDLSEEARGYYLQDGGSVRSTTAAKRHWKTPDGGGMLATGVGGPLLGQGYRLGVVDDPTDPRKVTSPVYQRGFREWWPSKWLSRQDGKNAAIVVVMQRLGVDDPIDYLFRAEVGEDTEEAVQNWHVVVCDEIKSDEPLGRWNGPMGLPPTCTLEPDNRKVGAVLAPTLLDKEAVMRRRQESGPYVVASQRQARPMQPSGDFWKKSWFKHTYDELPTDAYNGGWDWDTAYTKDEANAATAGIKSYRGVGDDKEFPIYIDDVNWDWLAFPEMVQWMGEFMGPHFVEEKASGKSAVQVLGKYGVIVEGVQVNGDKFARAAAAQPAASSGRVRVRRGVLDALLMGEGQGLLRVTAEGLQGGMAGLDVNDTFVQLIHRHLKLSEKPKKKKTHVKWV